MENNNNNNELENKEDRNLEIQGFYNYNLKSEPEMAEPPVQLPPSPPKPATQPMTQATESPAKPAQPAPPVTVTQAGQKPTGTDEPTDRARKPDKERGFKVNFDFDREYDDVPKESIVHVNRKRRTGCLGSVLFSVFVVCISIILASLLWLATTDVLGLGSEEEEIQVTVPEDYTVESIAEMLQETNLIKYKSLFVFYSKFAHIEEKIVAGTYVLNTSFDYMALVKGMSRTGARVTVDVLFPEGYTLYQIFNTLEENRVCSAEDMWEAAAKTPFDYEFLRDVPMGESHRLEGFLFPDTYTFYIGDTPSRVITIMLDNFNKRFKEEYYEKAELLGRSVRDVLIVASMIEREAGTDDDRPLIASVIYNRLASTEFPRLEIDATIRYVIAETGEAFSTSLSSPYNTYAHEGLPPGAISNPGLKSIEAALNPASTAYYFYALKHDGSHKFSETFNEHVEFVNSAEYGG